MQTYYYNKNDRVINFSNLESVDNARIAGGTLQIQRKGVPGWETLDMEPQHQGLYIQALRDLAEAKQKPLLPLVKDRT